MRLRLTKIDEYQFLTCLKHGLWGSRSARFKNWQKGDQLAFIVEKSLAGLAQVEGPPFESREKVWDNGLFPHRIPVKFTHVLSSKERPPILGQIRDALTQQWGSQYGWAILNQQVLESPNADIVVRAITSKPNRLAEFQQSLVDRLEEARFKRERGTDRRPPKPIKPAVPLTRRVELNEERVESKKDASAHTKAQSELVTLGRITGCSVWVASNDQGRSYAGQALSDSCLKKLPGMGLSDEAVKRHITH